MKPACLPVTVALFIIATSSFAQDDSYRFRKIIPADFSEKFYSIDSNASAVIFADVGSTVFVGNNKGWFTLVFRRHMRVRILKNSARDLATFRIRLYKKGTDEESIEDVKAVTYNESNGNVTESELEKHDIFEERLDKNHTEKKFSMPSVREGSIIDIAYTIKSDFDFNLQPWTFQHLSYPCLWSEYEIAVPGLLNYVFLKQGYDKYYIEKTSTRPQTYRITLPEENAALYTVNNVLAVNTTNIKYHWVMKDIKGLNDVDYLSTPDNYIDRIEFQLSQVSNGDVVKDVMTTWTKVTEDLLKSEDFAGALALDNFWLDRDLQSIAIGMTDPVEISKQVYEYVKNNYTCTGNGCFIKTKLSDVFRSRKGNAGEINLILIAMLRRKGIEADPVLASTVDNGRPYEKYPMISRYNYAFCRISVDNKFIYLDASHPFLGFGKLDSECYNGLARVINTAAESIELMPDSLKETKSTFILLVNDEKGNLKGTVNRTPGYYESYHLREMISKKGKDNFFSEIKKTFSSDAQVDNFRLDSFTVLNEPLGIHYDFMYKPESEIFYLNPLIGEGYEKNFFKSEERVLPVEMSFPANRTYAINLEIPKGYVVDEIPKSVMVKLNERGDGIFEYQVRQGDTYVSLRTKLVIKRTYFDADEYNMLREFFNLIAKKQNEAIVFKKKNG